MVVPREAKSARLFLLSPPRDTGTEGASPARVSEPPAGLCHQRPRCATASWLVPPGLELAPLFAGSWRLCVCVSNFKGMSYFLEKKKNGQIKQKANNTHEGGGFDWGFAVDFSRAPRSWARRCRWEIRAGMPWGSSGHEAAAPTPLPARGKGGCQVSPAASVLLL